MPRRQDRRRVRRSLALTAGALVLATPLLSACGFNERTNQPYTPGVGTNAVDAEVDVLSAVIVAAQPDSGTFIASLANNNETEEISFDGIAGANGNTIQPDEYAGVEIPPHGLVNLADDGGPTLAGTFEAGDFVPLSLNFGNGEVVTMTVPVVPACEEYAGLDTSAGLTTPTATPEGAYACGTHDEEAPEGGH